MAAFALTILGGALWVILEPLEPHYKGKPLTFWLEPLLLELMDHEQTEVVKQKSLKAINEIGTNGIPTYLRLLKEKDSKIRLKCYAAFDWLNDNYAVKINHLLDWQRNAEGYLGIKTLGTNATVAVPELIRIYEMNVSDNSRSAIVMSLGEIGPPAKDAIPFLIKWLNERPKQFDLIEVLGKIHSNPDLVVPVLTDHLTNSSTYSRQAAARALGEFGPDAKPAFGEIAKLLNDEKSLVRESASNSLKKIDPIAAAKLIR